MAQALKIGGEVQTKSWWVPLGNTGIVVPRLSIGTGTYGWGGSSAQTRLGFRVRQIAIDSIRTRCGLV